MPLLAPLYLLLLGGLLALLLGPKKPSNTRDWKPDMARPAEAVFRGDEVTLHNVRDIHYGPPNMPFVVRWETREYDLTQAKRLWFAVESFSRFEVIAHTLLSFEFEGGDYLAFSAEARLVQGENYDILRGLFNNFELSYTFGSERDFILRRTTYKEHDVYLYPLTLTPDEVRRLLEDILKRANRLREQPRFYNSITCNCTNLLFRHINRVRPGTFAFWEPAQVLPGLSDRLLKRKGLIASGLPLAKLREVYNVRPVAKRAAEAADVSAALRSEMPTL
jgi:hypothetical protein